MGLNHKPCVACAEQIKKEATLCRFCNTRQDDPHFSKNENAPAPTKRKLPKLLLPASALAIVLVVATSIIAFVSGQNQATEQTPVLMRVLDNGVEAPQSAENSDHGYLLEDARIPRFETCQEWEGFWDLEGPAVGFAAAAVYENLEIAVSSWGSIVHETYPKSIFGPTSLNEFKITKTNNFIQKSEWLNIVAQVDAKIKTWNIGGWQAMHPDRYSHRKLRDYLYPMYSEFY